MRGSRDPSRNLSRKRPLIRRAESRSRLFACSRRAGTSGTRPKPARRPIVLDVIFIAVGVGFLLICGLYLHACDRL
jgi:hypothetical protein